MTEQLPLPEAGATGAGRSSRSPFVLSEQTRTVGRAGVARARAALAEARRHRTEVDPTVRFSGEPTGDRPATRPAQAA